jgi:NIMA-interacting peptidyl-prolyl cis-trans isomerase 1
MVASTKMLRALVLVVLVVSSACGSKAKDPNPSNEEQGGFETADTRCLAIARATRESRKGNEPEKISVKHILVKFAGAKNAKADIKRSRGDACTRALEARKQLQAGEPFANVVAEYSDEPGAASREGLVGSIKRSDVAAPFADAAWELKPNEVSHVVETDFGYHIIMRTE